MNYLYSFKLDPDILESIDDCLEAERVSDVELQLAKANYRIVHLIRAVDDNFLYRMKCEDPKTIDTIIAVFKDHFQRKMWMNGPKPVVLQHTVFDTGDKEKIISMLVEILG